MTMVDSYLQMVNTRFGRNQVGFLIHAEDHSSVNLKSVYMAVNRATTCCMLFRNSTIIQVENGTFFLNSGPLFWLDNCTFTLKNSTISSHKPDIMLEMFTTSRSEIHIERCIVTNLATIDGRSTLLHPIASTFVVSANSNITILHTIFVTAVIKLINSHGIIRNSSFTGTVHLTSNSHSFLKLENCSIFPWYLIGSKELQFSVSDCLIESQGNSDLHIWRTNVVCNACVKRMYAALICVTEKSRVIVSESRIRLDGKVGEVKPIASTVTSRESEVSIFHSTFILNYTDLSQVDERNFVHASSSNISLTNCTATLKSSP